MKASLSPISTIPVLHGYKHRKYALAYNQFSRMYWLRTEEFYLAKQAQDFFYELYLKYNK